jgi:hypothetical protein
MEPWATAIAVGVVFVLPQSVGLVVARVGRHLPAIVWALGAAGTVAVLWALALFNERHAPCGTGREALNTVAPLLLTAHFLIGSILGTLDQRARRR